MLFGVGIVFLVAFGAIERRVVDPMFRLPLFRIRAFTFGTLSTFLSAVARGGLMFMLIIWLQGIWLPLHGYSFSETPLWAGIYMLPLTAGLLCAGPVSGYLSDRYGARPFATGGMIGAAISFGLLLMLPIDFSYPVFAADAGAERDRDGHVRLAQPRGRDEQPAARRSRRRRWDEPDVPELRPGGLDRDLLHADGHRARERAARTRSATGLEAHGSRARSPPAPRTFRRSRSCSPPSWATTRSRTCSGRTRSRAARLHPGGPHGRSFFPHLISAPFQNGLRQTFVFSIVACLLAAAASLLRGGQYHHAHQPSTSNLELQPDAR